ncbi:MAG: TatD family nuclease-associated radical SAM protein [Oscillospiraceae bacterium]|nr:TatD family nuclease-associated radical SAM protein [Oscillospiraceae bacterium]
MAFEPVYRVGDALYINLTNRCRNACDFCIRNKQDGVGGAENLWLDHEPAAAEILTAWEAFGPERYAETVFCGYGEPTERLPELLEVARGIRSRRPGVRVRLNTNGHGSLTAGRDITPELAGLVDCVSVSLNAVSAEEYIKLCHPEQGAAAYDAMLAFAGAAAARGLEVVLSVLADTTDEPAARKIAETLGATLRIRSAWG